MNNSAWRRPVCRAPWWRLILAAGIVWAGLLPGAASAAQVAPGLEVSETVHDFGKVFENQALTHEFVLKNSGKKALKVEEVETDCACTASKFDQVIPPGGQGSVTLTIKPTSTMRAFNKKGTVVFQDSQPHLVLNLKGYVQPFIDIQPNHIVRLVGAVNSDIQGQVRFISNLPAPWEITETKTNIPGMIEIKVKAEEPGRVYVLEVRNVRREAGRYAGIIEITTTAKERPRLVVRVFGYLYPTGGVAP